jgi:hypothetical protein
MQVSDKNYVYPPKPLYVPPSSSTFTDLDNDPNWIGEVKKNGWRMMVRTTSEGKLELWTRRKTLELTPLLNLRKELLSLNLPPDTILDGELLEHRGETKETMMLWGMFRWNGKWTNAIPYKEIIWRMSFIPADAKYLIKPQFVFEGKRKFYEELIKTNPEENEGLVLKKLDAPVPFSFTKTEVIRSWLKVKPNV